MTNLFINQKKKPMNNLNIIGVIGLGNAGAPILNNLYNSKKYKLIVFDIDKNKLNDVPEGITKVSSIYFK